MHNKATFRLRRNDLVLYEDKYIKNESGFSPVIIAGIILVVAVIVAVVIFVNKNFINNEQTNATQADIPPGVVVDSEGNICETQDATYCHETEDIDTWNDDGLP